MTPEYNVYDKVWLMQHNVPTKLIVYAVIHSMNYWKNGIETNYMLVASQIGASEKNSVTRSGKNIYSTKEELLGSL